MIGRFRYQGRIFQGEVRGDVVVDGDVETGIQEVEVLVPCEPTKIVGVGLNYYDHAEELGMKIPDEPIIFLKPTSALQSHEKPIVHPKVNRVDYEGELAVVISERCKNVSEKYAEDYILGYTCANDVTARDLQQKDIQWTRSKSFDTFAPVGPFIQEDVKEVDVLCKLNGKIVQKGNTKNMIFGVHELIKFISGVMTLEKGDVILTGTPAGVGKMNRGDVVEVEIEHIGTLRNPVI
jgi:2-keto-4-pentenoate hydratase/2-oxohepta-3-ene-1,7-dioic acid hydratase in catechol pathway